MRGGNPGPAQRSPRPSEGLRVDDVAWELGVSRATLYQLIGRYRATRTVEGLWGTGRGRQGGARVLDGAKETLINEIIEREYLKLTRPPFRRVLEHIGLSRARPSATRSNGEDWYSPRSQDDTVRTRALDRVRDCGPSSSARPRRLASSADRRMARARGTT